MTMRIALACFVLLAVSTRSGFSAEVADKASSMVPGQIHFSGWLGQRVDANWKNRLMTVSLDERIKPFCSRTEREGWSGEHIGKWLHAASIMWQYTQDPALRKRLDEAAAALAAAQAPDGYLGTYANEHRWGGWDVWTHKYNLLGLLAYYDISRDPKALAAARKIGDLLIDTFGEGKRDIIKSGTHVGMAATSVLEPVVLLYRASGDPRYLEFARYIVRAYDQPNGPKIVRTLNATRSVAKTANRKAYEMMSNLVGLCELYRSTGEASLLQACIYAHDDIVENQMYLTGGTSLGEHFQNPHQLPNTGAVSENCAQVTWLQLSAQLLRITGEAKYADTLERIVYNHLLASQKPDGRSLCYFTPLAGKKPYGPSTNCCTSSGPRGIALTTTFAYTVSPAAAPTALCVNFYEPSTLEVELSGVKTKVTQTTRYPVDGVVELAVEPQRPVQFDLLARIPGWCKSSTASLGGQPLEAGTPGKYLKVSRQWKPGDRLRLEFAMPALLVQGDYSNKGMVAVVRGPLVLALDSRLNPGLTPGSVSPVAEADGRVRLTPASDPAGLAAHAFQGEAVTPVAEGDRIVLRHVPVVWTSFAEAGQTGSNFAVWLPAPERLKMATASPFRFGMESYSRRGNIEGSIADGDLSKWRVTFDRTKREEDWFAVERATPVTIDTVTVAHGHVFPDGGWWDASKGKPRIQVKKTPGGAWEDIAVIDGYPETTATDSKGLADGKEFVVHFPPLAAAGIRVIGVPACGSSPKQNFASCAELQGCLEKR